MAARINGQAKNNLMAGVRVEAVEPKSPAARAGIMPGDRLLSINAEPLSDCLDYLFHSPVDDDEAVVRLVRGSTVHDVHLAVSDNDRAAGGIGLSLEHFDARTCRNNCLFCFVSQLPRGLRRPLYVKDEDFRMSFLYGNYVTLTGLSGDDRKRIIRQRLSPLYVSVHSTNRRLRNLLLGNPKAPDIMQELQRFGRRGIRFHCQIVICPGYNDAAELKRTLDDLASLHPSVLSVAVVPVGLTDFHRKGLRLLAKDDALSAIRIIDSRRNTFSRRLKDPLIHAADELYIKAGLHFPKLEYYGEMSQLENGVGMVSLFLDQARRLRIKQQRSVKPCLTFTGSSFYPFLKRFAGRLSGRGLKVDVVGVENRAFGSTVSVAGLLTGRDIIEQLRPAIKGHSRLLVPDVALREGGGVFLDDVSVKDLGSALGLRVEVIESTPKGLAEALLK